MCHEAWTGRRRILGNLVGIHVHVGGWIYVPMLGMGRQDKVVPPGNRPSERFPYA